MVKHHNCISLPNTSNLFNSYITKSLFFTSESKFDIFGFVHTIMYFVSRTHYTWKNHFYVETNTS